MFDSFVDFLKTNIDELNGHELQISSEFKEHHNEDSKYIIKNWLFSSPEYRKWRITRLDGDKKLQVFNTCSFSPPSNLVILHFLYSGDEKSQFLMIYFESLL